MAYAPHVVKPSDTRRVYDCDAIFRSPRGMMPPYARHVPYDDSGMLATSCAALLSYARYVSWGAILCSSYHRTPCDSTAEG